MKKLVAYLAAVLCCVAVVGSISNALDHYAGRYDASRIEYNNGTVTLDLAQWQCRQAETVLTLIDDKLTPVGQCTRYERIISED